MTLAGALLFAGCADPKTHGSVPGGEDGVSSSDAGASDDSEDEGDVSDADEGDDGPSGDLGCDKMDVLFVIDNSGSMVQEQENLAANFPGFVSVLEKFSGGTLDFRIGVTTTSFPAELFGQPLGTAEQGMLLKTGSMEHPWLQRGEPNLTQTFEDLATVGTDGSSMEQPLLAAEAAVTDRVSDGTNAGFLRDDALFAIVILTDEEDSSGAESPLPFVQVGEGRPVKEFYDAFNMVKGGPKGWAAAIIAGDQEPVCTSAFGDASYAARLIEFAGMAGTNGVVSSICEGDLAKSFEKALDTFVGACDNFVVY